MGLECTLWKPWDHDTVNTKSNLLGTEYDFWLIKDDLMILPFCSSNSICLNTSDLNVLNKSR